MFCTGGAGDHFAYYFPTGASGIRVKIFFGFSIFVKSNHAISFGTARVFLYSSFKNNTCSFCAWWHNLVTNLASEHKKSHCAILPGGSFSAGDKWKRNRINILKMLRTTALFGVEKLSAIFALSTQSEIAQRLYAQVGHGRCADYCRETSQAEPLNSQIGWLIFDPEEGH